MIVTMPTVPPLKVATAVPASLQDKLAMEHSVMVWSSSESSIRLTIYYSAL